MCYTEEATKAWHRQGRPKQNRTKNIHCQPKRPSPGTPHRSSTELHRNINPRVKSHATHQHSNPARSSVHLARTTQTQ